MRRWQQRVYAMLTVFVMLFCSIDFSSLAEKSSGGGVQPTANDLWPRGA